ncbi:MAG TPA: hypothetical protein DCK98_10125 [Chloroflexi bacterium]|jgi:hypothetical protein|nr:hypothetical protein [Chloroflexota bacterium]HAL26324.1 hypothetical protein [Chloroflexota bacterium]
MDKRRVSTAPATYAANRASGRPRHTPVGDGLRGDEFWIVADHGVSSISVKNIRHDSAHGAGRARPAWHDGQ